jgi:hypothetical protein
VTQARYLVEPAAGKVAVSVRITATNHLRNTVTKTYYFRTAYLAVLPDTTGFRLTATGARPSVAVSKRTSTYTLLRLDFGANLAAGKTRVMTLTFDLKDPGGAPDRPIRISSTLVSFYAWAYGTPSTPGSTVSVTFPSGYDVTVGRGPLNGPTTDGSGNQTWASASIADALSFVADLTADHPSSYVESTDAVTIGGSQAQLVLRSWPDDSAWRDRVSKLLGEGLPVLASDHGLPWPPDQSPLIVQEALVRTTGGYAGLFDPSKHLIEIAYAAPTGVVLHEAAHAWLNGQLLADRWAAEAFASYYASVAAGQLQVKISSPVMTPQEQAAAIPLNAWGAVGTEPAETEAYAYAASLTLAQAIAARAGADGLRKVWAQAAAGEGAYQPPNGPPETGAAAPDWRGLLDLLEDDTSASYVDLWRTWVVRPGDVAALNERQVARASYEQALADASPWALPASIRSAMRAWSFADAERELADAETVIGQRAAVQREAAAAGLQLPATLQHDFESGNLADAATEASVELTTVQAIEAATSSRIAQPDPLEAIGLLGTSPDTDLSTARNALAAGDLAGAVNAAGIARTDWTSAENVGRGRLIGAALLAAALVLFAGLLWGRRRRGPVTATGPETTPTDPGEAPDGPASGPPASDDPAPASATPGPAR